MSGNPPLQIRLSADRRARYEAAAERAGKKLVDWARDRLDRDADDLSDVNPRVVRLPEVELARQVAEGGKKFTGPDPKTGRR